MIVMMLVALLLLPTLAEAQWTNEPSGSTNLLNCTFDNNTCNGQILNLFNSGTIQQPSPAGLVSPTNALTSTLNPCKSDYTNPPPPALGSGCQGGGEWIYPPNTATAASRRELYVGLIFMMNTGFQQNSVGTNKIFFMRAHNWLFGGSPTNGYFAVRGPVTGMQLIFSHNTGAIDNSHTCSEQLGLTCFPNAGSVTLVRGVQYKIEACIRASTTTTSRDGVLKVWVNGVKIHDRTNFNYGTGVVNETLIGQTWDGAGNGCCPTQQWNFYFDHWRVSAPPSGGCGTPSQPPLDNPPGAPGTVTGVTVTVQ